MTMCIKSHPTWVRGLKPRLRCLGYIGVRVSHPTWVRGLKHALNIYAVYIDMSHPTWVRGLKLNARRPEYRAELSHPTWVRGLKLPLQSQRAQNPAVAPHVGAWIETFTVIMSVKSSQSHPTWVRGLKPEVCAYCNERGYGSHPTWVRGLKLHGLPCS